LGRIKNHKSSKFKSKGTKNENLHHLKHGTN
jgi:hypothetical protein